MTRHNITFHLPAGSVAEGVQRRDSASIAASALRELRDRPLLGGAGRTTTPPPAAPPAAPHHHHCPEPAGCRLSMRFVPAPAAPAAAPAAQLQLQLGGLFGSAMAVGGRLPWPFRAAVAPAPEPPPVQCHEVDQYSVPPLAPGDPEPPHSCSCGRLLELAWGVLCRNHRPDRAGERPLEYSPLLGRTGHYERFSAWSHIVGFALFVAFGLVRLCVPTWNETVQGVLTSVAAWTTAFVFFSSSVYHVTAPDRFVSMFTRFLDFAAIYIGITTSATADIAVATQGFDAVPVVTIIDLPVAGLIVVLFFLWRRHRLGSDETWGEFDREVPDDAKSNPELRCAIGRGLFNRGHDDLHHSQLRSATSLLLTASYFMSVPAAVMTLDADVSWLVLLLQGLAFATIVGGMVLDKVVNWPNSELVKGRHACLACPEQGCALTAHGLWHLIALLSTTLTVVAREYAVQSYD